MDDFLVCLFLLFLFFFYFVDNFNSLPAQQYIGLHTLPRFIADRVTRKLSHTLLGFITSARTLQETHPINVRHVANKGKWREMVPA